MNSEKYETKPTSLLMRLFSSPSHLSVKGFDKHKRNTKIWRCTVNVWLAPNWCFRRTNTIRSNALLHSTSVNASVNQKFYILFKIQRQTRKSYKNLAFSGKRNCEINSFQTLDRLRFRKAKKQNCHHGCGRWIEQFMVSWCKWNVSIQIDLKRITSAIASKGI